jgi:NADPH:quinone reductase-like Zn-dependent oxidoreductase
MKAAVYSAYGPPEAVRIADVATPVPGPDDALVRIRATTVSTADWRARSLVMPRGFGPFGRLAFGLLGPRQPILGTELAGIVEAVGARVTRFKPGDEVVAFLGAQFGCHAEYRVVPESANIVRKPVPLSFEEAGAMCFGGMTALYYLRSFGQVLRGDEVLVIGASGAVGSAAVQLAKHFGAVVTGVCSGANVEAVRSLGAARVIDYTREDYAASAGRFDIVFDTTGRASFAACGHLLKPGGRLLLVVATLGQLLGAGWPRPEGKRVIAGPAKERLEDLVLLAQLAEAGAYRPLVGCSFPLEQIVEAHRLVDSGHKRGSAVISLGA